MERLRLLYIGNRLGVHGNTPTGIEILGPRLESEGYAVAYASSKRNKLLRFCDMLFSVVANRKADYVLIDTYSTQNFWYAFAVAALCRLLNMKYIPILHGGNLPRRLKSNTKLSSFIFKHSLINVAPSNYLKTVFENNGFNVVHIPNPVDIDSFTFKSRQAASPKFLWVRGFSRMSNPRMALDAFEMISHQYPNAELCMVGPDKEGMMPELQQVALSRSLKVEFPGKLSREQWASRSTAFDIFLNTSHVDNAPFSLVEAAALGMFIITTNVGGIPHLLTHRREALFVSDNDPQAMAKAAVDIMQDDALRAELQYHMRSFVKQFDWNVIRNQWFEIFK